MEFAELEGLRLYLAKVQTLQRLSLQPYYNGSEIQPGFRHKYDDTRPDHISEASTATCVLSLLATGTWHEGPWSGSQALVAKQLLDAEWKSAELPPDNVFSASFVLEAVTALLEVVPEVVEDVKYRARLAQAEDILIQALRTGDGAVRLYEYPPSAYLTQLSARALGRARKLTPELVTLIVKWAWEEVYRQFALVTAGTPSSDAFQLAYSIMLVSAFGDPAQESPDDHLILNAGLDLVFRKQNDDGSWPRSRPLFHYPKVGSAYCYEYEMLVQLLGVPQLTERLLQYLPHLQRATEALDHTQFQLASGGRGWASGHHPQFKGPESWSTASVYHFAYMLDRLLAEALRQGLFRHFDKQYVPPQKPKDSAEAFAPNFLDSVLMYHSQTNSLREILYERFVRPIAAQAGEVARGRRLTNSTAMSAILFGPPGTAKTRMAEMIADYLGWPLLTIDPSYFVRRGLDQVQAEADKIFGMLTVAEQVVVLLDEFDEMVRDRMVAEDVLSRFLTTAMLPKLVAINKNRKIVFLVATNYIDHFDLAISRRGRFDAIVQIMPPSADAKLQHFDALANSLVRMRIDLGDNLTLTNGSAIIRAAINALTYDECRALEAQLTHAETQTDALGMIGRAYEGCILSSPVDPSKGKHPSWEEASKDQEEKVRVPDLA